jgi:hypothetical protein
MYQRLTVYRYCSELCRARSALQDGIFVCYNSSHIENHSADVILMSKIRIARNPTTHSSESNVAKAHESEPWKTGRSSVYMYHPGGDTSNPPKDAPSALNEVIIPNVNLPKVCSINRRHAVQIVTDSLQSLHEQFNKYGKEGY